MTNHPQPRFGPVADARRRIPCRLRDILALSDLERAAERQLPCLLFGYLQRGVEDNVSGTANTAPFPHWMLLSKVLVNVSERRKDTTLIEKFAEL